MFSIALITSTNSYFLMTYIFQESSFKPRYSLNYHQWGAFRDTNEKIDKYWYFGALRQLAAYIFGSQYNAPIQMEITYTPPCSGCSKCYKKRLDKVEKKEKVENRRWWHAFVPRTNSQSKYHVFFTSCRTTLDNNFDFRS